MLCDPATAEYLSARNYLITDTAAFENTSLYRYQKTQADKSAQSEIRLCYLLLHYFYKTTLHYTTSHVFRRTNLSSRNCCHELEVGHRVRFVFILETA